ncbi:MAG: ribulose-phosphate 3-epimerase [Eubacteriales bacterium]|nr:ribulose-phosphate 3-epimerase [Eubacteriales bacterium]
MLQFKGKKAIGPSLLSADFTDLRTSVGRIEAEMDFLHFDVMDGHFVPNLSFGPMLCKAVRKLTDKAIDCHLMVTNPSSLIKDFQAAGANLLSVHIETLTHGHRVLQEIKDAGMECGLVLNPLTPLNLLEEYLPYLDLVLLMSVNPGFGGQSYIPSVTDKVRRLRQIIDASGYDILLEVDGGVKLENIAEISAAGADLFVAGSAVFGAPDPALRIRELRAMAENV